MKKKTRARFIDAGPILDRMFAADPRLRASVDDEMPSFDVAQLVYDARTHAGLTQQQLAKLVGTTQPVIARLEDAGYRGHSLRMLRRIAAALKKDVEIRIVPRAG